MALNQGKVRATLEVAGADEFSQDLDKAAHAIGKFRSEAKSVDDEFKMLAGKGLTGAAVAIAAVTAAATAAAHAVAELARHTGDLVMRGGQVHDVMSAFAAAGGTARHIENLREATGGFVRDMDMLPRMTAVMRAGMVDVAVATQLFGRAVQAARGHNVDMVQALQSVQQVMMGGGLEEATRILGVNYTAIRDSMMRVGISSESMEGRLRGLNMIFDQMNETMGTNRMEAATLADEWQQVTAEAGNFYDAVANIVTSDESLITFFQDMRQELESNGMTAERVGEMIVDAIRSVILVTQGLLEDTLGWARAINMAHRAYLQLMASVDAIGRALDWAADQSDRFLGTAFDRASYSERIATAREFGESIDEIGDRLHGAASAFDALAAAAAGASASMQQSIDDTARAADELDDILDMSGTDDTGAPVSRPEGGTSVSTTGLRAIRRRRGGGGTPTYTPTGDVREGAALADELLRAVQGQAEEFLQSAIQDVFGYYVGVEEEETRIQDLKVRHHEQTLEMKAEEGRQAEEEAARELRRIELQREQQAHLHQQRMAALDAAAQGASAMGSVFGMIAENIEAQGKAADGWRKAEGVALGIMYGIKAGAEVAEAVASFASQNYAGGALHIVSAGLFTAQSVAAFANLAQSGGGASTAAATKPAASFTPARPEAMAPASDAGGRTVIIEKKYYLSETLAELGEAAESGRYEMSRQRSLQGTPSAEYM